MKPSRYAYLSGMNAAYLSAYVMIFLLTYLSGQRMLIQYGLWQLLDAIPLRDRFWESLLHLHSQPPFMNFLLGIGLKIQSSLGIAAEDLFLVIHFILGGVIVLNMGFLTGSIIRNRVISTAVMMIFLADYMYYVVVMDFFYTVYEMFFLTSISIFTYMYLKSLRLTHYIIICLISTALVYTRSLFHFLWAVILLFSLPWIACKVPIWKSTRFRGILASFLVTLSVLLAWPMKNYVKFGVFSYSSWQGYNLARSLPIPLRYYKPVGKDIVPFARLLVPANFLSVPVLSEPIKSDGESPNWNFFAIIPWAKKLQREALHFYLHNPRIILEKAISGYLEGYASYHGRDVYTGTWDNKVQGTIGPYWLRLYELVVFQFFGTDSRKGPITGFALVVPIIFVLAVRKIIRCWRTFPLEAKSSLILLFSIFWVLAMVMFIDGIEGNRMRISTTPLLFLLAGWILAPSQSDSSNGFLDNSAISGNAKRTKRNRRK